MVLNSVARDNVSVCENYDFIVSLYMKNPKLYICNPLHIALIQNN